MSNPYADFIKEAEAYCQARSIKLSTLSYNAVNSSRTFDGLGQTRNTSLKTIERIREYMRAHPPKNETSAA